MSETFGNRLRALIKQQGLNQQELADALDVSRNTVWRWINDKATPESYILQNLATVLHVSVDSLFNDNQDNSDDWILSITVRQELKEEVIDFLTIHTRSLLLYGRKYFIRLNTAKKCLKDG